jgi:hypothetical protein
MEREKQAGGNQGTFGDRKAFFALSRLRIQLWGGLTFEWNDTRAKDCNWQPVAMYLLRAAA